MTSIYSDYSTRLTSWAKLALCTLVAYAAFKFLEAIYTYWTSIRSPLRVLPGPKGASWLFGHMRQLLSLENTSILYEWTAQYGDTFAIRGIFGVSERHRDQASHFLRSCWLQSSLVPQRRLMNPAFGHAHVRDMTPTFLEASAQLCDILHNLCMNAGGTARVDMLDWLSKTTLTIIGKAGFDYDFNALNEKGVKSELAVAFERFLRSNPTTWVKIRVLIDEYAPRLGAVLPNPRAKVMAEVRAQLEAICMRIVLEKKQAILAELGGHVEKKAVVGKDLISLLLRANLAADLEPSQRLTDKEVLDQIPTLLVAGEWSLCNQTAWTLFKLATHPAIQAKLRAEVQQVGTDMPTLDELNSLDYLDHVAREALRLDSVVAYLPREVVQDDVIPLGVPARNASGDVISQLKVQKGDGVLIPVRVINRSKAIWGPDAEEFRPERWESLPTATSSIPGISPHLMTFIGGPRSCIGHRFAVAEIKVLLFHIVRRFEFRLAVDAADIYSTSNASLRPQLRGDDSFQMPLLMSPVE
ncbi:cytochrome P450 [Auricularia subglabra TFB-10046 SS5]|nr:cytochrome P450 [Auricularia subglabra TFB-10046 SS5]